jgi:serine/threonine-protein kinase
MTIDVGTVLSDRYELVEPIATGGMGQVWRATDTVLGRDVAVKCLKAEYAEDADFSARFAAEARHTAGLSHPGIASIYDYGKADGTAYLVMELVQGEPLSALLRREGRLSTKDTLTIVGQAATALHAAHNAGVIHRDVKPGNILVTPGLGVKVTDFGIARVMNADSHTQTGLVMGTAHYLSPEQGSGGEITPASDVYALGVVAYECLAGARPFDGGSAVQIAMAHINEEPPALPADVDESARMLVMQAMAKTPAERFANAGAFARAAALLQERLDGSITEPLALAVAAPTLMLPVQGGDAVAVADAPMPSAASRHTSRTPLLVALGVIALLLVVAAVMAAARGDADGVPKGTKPTTTTSPGPKLVTLPAGLIGMTRTEALAALTKAGLKPTATFAENHAPAGTVIDINPSSGLVSGAPVQIVVSSGPPDEKGKGKGKGEEGKDD